MSREETKWYEWLIPLAAGCSLLGHCCIVSPRAPMWLDEVYTYYAVTHGSFADFVQSYNANIIAIPPMYLFLVWAVSKIIPLSALSLRLYSSLGFGMGLLLIWATLRRHMSFFIASVATLAVCLTSDLLLAHNVEARLYGMYFAIVAWLVYNYDRLCVDTPSRRQLVANALSHALAVSCTYVAGFYSLAVLLSLIIRDRSFRVWRPKVYASVIAGWIPILFYLPFIWGQRGGAPGLQHIGPGTIFNPFTPGLHLYFAICALVALAVIGGVEKWNAPEPAGQPAGGPLVPLRQSHLLVLACAFLFLPYLLLVILWAGLPLLLDRYLLPSLIGVVLLFALICSRVLGASYRPAGRGGAVCPGSVRFFETLVCVVTLAGLLAYPFKHARTYTGPSFNPVKGMDFSRTVLATSNPLTYFVPYFESGENHNIYWVVKNKKEYDQWKRFNPRLNPITTADFLAAHQKFLVLGCDWYPIGNWFEQDLRNGGAFDIKTEDGWPSNREGVSEGVRLLTVSHN